MSKFCDKLKDNSTQIPINFKDNQDISEQIKNQSKHFQIPLNSKTNPFQEESQDDDDDITHATLNYQIIETKKLNKESATKYGCKNKSQKKISRIKDNQTDIAQENDIFQKSSKEDFKQLLKSCIENALSYLLEYIPNIFTLYLINNNTNQIEASGFGLGVIWINCIGQSLYYGLGSGFETLAAHAHGAGNYKQVGLLYQRTLFISMIMFIPIFSCIIFSENILQLWNSDIRICRQAANFSISALLGVFFGAIAFQFKASLNAQNIYDLQYKAVVWTIPFNLLTSYFLISQLKLKVNGGGLTFCCTQLTQLVLLYYLVKQDSQYQKCYIPFDNRCMQEIVPFLKDVIPIESLLTLEWVVYESFSMLASNLPPAQFSAHIILSNFNIIYYQIPEGFSITTSTFVGNEMGNNMPNRAKRFARYGLIIAFLNFSITLIPILYFKQEIIQTFSVDEEVFIIVDQAYIVFVIVVICDSSQVMLTCLMRAIGKEYYSSVSFILCYIFLGVFSAYLLTYHLDFQIYGILFGTIIGCLSYNLLQIHQLYKSNWHMLAQFIKERIDSHDQQELEDIKQNLI
ncbi:hypothetical protein ABPG72_005950 [Tetrahymena utriculariae]